MVHGETNEGVEGSEEAETKKETRHRFSSGAAFMRPNERTAVAREHELSLSPSVNARLHGARTCPLAIYTEWPPVTWVLNTSIHARSGRIKASHVQFHGTKIFFRGISILLPAPLRRPRVKPLFGTLVEGRLSRLPLSTSPHLQHNARGSACATHEDRHRISGLTRDDDGQG